MAGLISIGLGTEVRLEICAAIGSLLILAGFLTFAVIVFRTRVRAARCLDSERVALFRPARLRLARAARSGRRLQGGIDRLLAAISLE